LQQCQLLVTGTTAAATAAALPGPTSCEWCQALKRRQRAFVGAFVGSSAVRVRALPAFGSFFGLRRWLCRSCMSVCCTRVFSIWAGLDGVVFA
jgi:hypothetical protein